MHNHLKKLALLEAEGKVPTRGMWHCYVGHDDWCALLNDQGDCNCDPKIQFYEDPVWQAMQRANRQ